MTYRFMRIIDDHLGMLLCKILGGVLRLKQLILPGSRHQDHVQVKRILIQKYFGMGSILHAIPLISALRRNYPDAAITFITIGSNQETLSLCGIADSVLLVDFKSPAAFIKSCLKLIINLLTTRFDLSVDLEFFAKFPLLIAAFSRAPIRVGLFHRKVRPAGILTHTVTFNFYRHISQIYLAYADALGVETLPADSISPLPSFRRELEAILRSRFHLHEAEQIIIVNINSGDLFSFRKWPEQSFVALISRLVTRHPSYAYILIGSGAERDYVERICRQVVAHKSRLLNCAGQTTLKELFALIEMAALVITNDSGPLHIASLYGKNIAAFFGPETPVVYGPQNSNALVFYPDNLYCSPCLCVYDSKQSLYAETCHKNICLSQLQPEEVLTGIEKRFLGAPRLPQ